LIGLPLRDSLISSSVTIATVSVEEDGMEAGKGVEGGEGRGGARGIVEEGFEQAEEEEEVSDEEEDEGEGEEEVESE
jgi:hypothetical protein